MKNIPGDRKICREINVIDGKEIYIERKEIYLRETNKVICVMQAVKWQSSDRGEVDL